MATNTIQEHISEFLREQKRKRESARINKKIEKQRRQDRIIEIVYNRRLSYYKKLEEAGKLPTIKDLALKDLKIAKKMGWLDREGYPYVDLVLYFSAEFGDDLMELERLYE